MMHDAWDEEEQIGKVFKYVILCVLGYLADIQSISLAFEHSISVHGKFMVCMCSQFQCTPMVRTNHKFP